MSGSTSIPGGGATARRQPMEGSEVTGWVGWIVFTGTMMAFLGVFHMFQGLVALFRSTEIAFPTSGLAIQVSFTQWGWLQIIAGALVFAVGLGLFTGRMWARVLGVILVSISALVNFAWATMFPVWSITLLAIDFLVLYALIAHGSEMKVAREA
jgi:vacuolar-type H+-ATPase subunit I/STV1